MQPIETNIKKKVKNTCITPNSGIFWFPWSKTKNYVCQWQRSVQKTQIDSVFVKVKISYFKRVTVNYVIYSQISKIIWFISPVTSHQGVIPTVYGARRRRHKLDGVNRCTLASLG